MRKPLVVGNWKMNGTKQSIISLTKRIVSSATKCHTVICPPSVFLGQVQELTKDSSIQVGAQNLDWHEAGAYTGEVSAAMLLEFGCRYSCAPQW